MQIYYTIMNRNFSNTNVATVALILFVIFYIAVIVAKPKFLYKPDNTLRAFGVGYKNKTFLPLWLLSLLLGVICYLAVLYYLEFQEYL